MSFLLLLSLIAMPWGIVALRNHTKSLPWSLKYAPVLLTAFGTVVAWQHVAASFPVVENVHVQILDVQKQRITVDLTGDKIRDCKRVDLAAFLIDKQGKTKEADVVHLGNPQFGMTHVKPGHFDSKAVLVITGYDDQYNSLYFRTIHECAFGVMVTTTFGQTPIPEAFNVL